jgi:hypothetical protein
MCSAPYSYFVANTHQDSALANCSSWVSYMVGCCRPNRLVSRTVQRENERSRGQPAGWQWHRVSVIKRQGVLVQGKACEPPQHMHA